MECDEGEVNLQLRSFTTKFVMMGVSDSCVWYDDVQETAREVFQSVLMLMSPVNRTSLRMLLQFIDHLPVHLHSSMSKTEVSFATNH